MLFRSCFHFGVPMEMTGKRHGVLAVGPHPQMQRLQASQSKVAVHWVRDGAQLLIDAAAYLVDELRSAHDDPSDEITMSVDVLGRAVDNHVNSRLQGLKEVGGREGVVDDCRDIPLFSPGDDGFDVRDLERRIVDRLEIDYSDRKSVV